MSVVSHATPASAHTSAVVPVPQKGSSTGAAVAAVRVEELAHEVHRIRGREPQPPVARLRTVAAKAQFIAALQLHGAGL